jgi:TonB family protein
MSRRALGPLILYAMACGCAGSQKTAGKDSIPFVSRVTSHVAPHWRPDLLRAPAEGVTVLQLRLRRDGSLANVVVEKSSGLDFLDEEAMGAVLMSAPFLDAMPAPPALLDRSGTIAFSVAFDYRPAVRD